MPRKEIRFRLKKLDRLLLIQEGNPCHLEAFINAFVEFASSEVPVIMDFVYISYNRMYFVVRRQKNKFKLKLAPLSEDAWYMLFAMKLHYFEEKISLTLNQKTEVLA
jgi:hypothetical protein